MATDLLDAPVILVPIVATVKRLAPPITRVRGDRDPLWLRWTLTLLALGVLGLLVVVPVVNVFVNAFGNGVTAYFRALFADVNTRHAMLLTLTVAPIAVVLNTIFGVAAAWALARFQFRGRALLIALIDLPFSVSPVVAGLVFVLLFGLQGWFGPWLQAHGIRVIFATPGLILVTTFVTVPFVARELLPVLEANGPEEELAALSLGASGWQMFWRITVPHIRIGLLYGVILCNARAMGEFGAVYVVSGRIGGQTDTIPIQVQKLFDTPGHNGLPAAFALASVLTLLALVTLIAKVLIEPKLREKSEGEVAASE